MPLFPAHLPVVALALAPSEAGEHAQSFFEAFLDGVILIFVAPTVLVALAIISLVLASVLRGRPGRRHRASVALVAVSLALSGALAAYWLQVAPGVGEWLTPLGLWMCAPLSLSVIALLVLWLKAPATAPAT